MRLKSLIIACALQFVALPAISPAQPADSIGLIYRITLTDGSSIIATLSSSSPDSLSVVTAAGLPITLPRRMVAQMERLRGGFKDGKYYRTDPNGSRLLLGPTARPLRAGEGYFAAYEIFFMYLGIGIADFISAGGGITVVPGASNQVFYLAPKLAFTTEDGMWSGAAGLIHMNAFSSNEDGIGIVYGMGTYGTPRAGLTFGLGYGYMEGDFEDDPIILVGGEVQVSNSFKLLSENWFAPGGDLSLLSFGFRFFGDNLSADLGFFYPMESGEGISEGFPFIPWIGFAYNFGK